MAAREMSPESLSGWRQVDVRGTEYYDFLMSATPGPGLLEFVYTDFFRRTRKGVLTDEEMQAVENELLENPERGDTMGDTGGVRKIRAATEGRGKSGSARVAYLYVEERATVYFILAFPKNVQPNLTAAQKKVVREEAEGLKAEPWPPKKRREPSRPENQRKEK